MMNKAAIARVLCKMGKSNLSAGETSECLQGMKGLIKVLSSQFASGGKVGSSIKSTERPVTKPTSKFNPRGQDYDYERAASAGMGPTATGENVGHWGSVAPATTEEMEAHGLPEGSYIMLKGSLHPTWDKAVAAENARGSNIQKLGDRYFSVPQPRPALSYQSGGFVPTTPPPPTRKFYGTWNGRPVTEEQMKVLEATQAQNEANDPIQQELNDYAREATARAAARRAAATTK
jgi:hypothetical protein